MHKCDAGKLNLVYSADLRQQAEYRLLENLMFFLLIWFLFDICFCCQFFYFHCALFQIIICYFVVWFSKSNLAHSYLVPLCCVVFPVPCSPEASQVRYNKQNTVFLETFFRKQAEYHLLVKLSLSYSRIFGNEVQGGL